MTKVKNVMSVVRSLRHLEEGTIAEFVVKSSVPNAVMDKYQENYFVVQVRD